MRLHVFDIVFFLVFLPFGSFPFRAFPRFHINVFIKRWSDKVVVKVECTSLIDIWIAPRLCFWQSPETFGLPEK